jgi:hypothetical protein
VVIRKTYRQPARVVTAGRQRKASLYAVTGKGAWCNLERNNIAKTAKTGAEMTDAELEEQVQDFAAHREEMKTPMTAIAIKQLRNRALRMRAQGVDLYEAFDKAISSGWLSIYPPKKEEQARPASHARTTLPDYGPRSAPETARDAVQNALRLVKRA